jgi:acetate kinase
MAILKILVINAGSSSIKVSLFDSSRLNEPAALWKASLLFTEGNKAELSVSGKEAGGRVTCASYSEGMSIILNAMGEGVVIDVVGHRIVHGGNYYSDSVVIDDEVVRNLKQCIELAPEHGPANMEGILAARKHLPNALQVAVFDTAFHQTMPESAKVLPGPYEWYEKQGIRRFGFHGISHKYCAGQAAEILGVASKPGERMINCHLGAGASLCAIKNGASVMTTMSFTPLDGLVMKTRSGSIDAGVLLHLMRKSIYSADKLDQALNGESGLKGISGLSGDMRELIQDAGSGNKRAQLALEMFVNSVASNIAALVTCLGGLDALIFTAGIGENSAEVRSMICKKLAFLGVELDEKQNADAAEDKLISASSSQIQCLVIHTREDLLIARECNRLDSKSR